MADWYLLGVMTYELLVGIPPYYDNDREILFENIKRGPLKIPRTLSPDAKDFIVAVSYLNLLQKATQQRSHLASRIRKRRGGCKRAYLALRNRLGPVLQ